MASIPIFPTLNDSLIKKCEFHLLSKVFYYHDNGKEKRLNLVENEDINKLEDHQGQWNFDEDDLGFKGSFEICNPNAFFGKNGVANSRSTLGIALAWKSVESRQRGSISLGTFGYGKRNLTFTFQKDFEAGQFKGDVAFTLTLYLAKPGESEKGENFFANESGMMLGELIDPFIIQFEGNGSIFPIYEVALTANSPLCDVTFDWDDPAEDLFEESVMIKINTSHPSYHYIEENSVDYNPQLFIDELAQALFVLCLEIKEDQSAWTNVLNGNGFKPGSVLAAVSYFIKVLEWNVTGSNMDLLNSIKKFMEEYLL